MASIIGDALFQTGSQIFGAARQHGEHVNKTTGEITKDEHLNEYIGDTLVGQATARLAERSPILAHLSSTLFENYKHRKDIDRHVNEKFEHAPEQKEKVREILREGAKLHGKELKEYKETHSEVYKDFDEHRKGRTLGKAALHNKIQSLFTGPKDDKPPEDGDETTAKESGKELDEIVKNTGATVDAIKSLGDLLEQKNSTKGGSESTPKLEDHTRSTPLLESAARPQSSGVPLLESAVKTKNEQPTGVFGKQDSMLKRLTSKTSDVIDVVAKQKPKSIASTILTKTAASTFASTGTIVPQKNAVRNPVYASLKTAADGIVGGKQPNTVSDATVKENQPETKTAEPTKESGGLMDVLGLGNVAKTAGNVAKTAGRFLLPAAGVAAAGVGGYMLGKHVINPAINSFMENFGSYDNEKIGNAPTPLPSVTPTKQALQVNQQREVVTAAAQQRQQAAAQQPIIVNAPTSVNSSGGSGGSTPFLATRNFESSFSKVQQRDYWSKTV